MNLTLSIKSRFAYELKQADINLITKKSWV